MGRKGVSKRKPSQKKAGQLSNENASSGLSPVGRALASQPVKLPEQDAAAIPGTRGSYKQSANLRKNLKKH